MNIFVLDLDPKKCAEYHCNSHIVKMATEHNQIFGSVSYLARGIDKKKDITQEFIQKHFQNFPRQKDNQPFPYGIGYKNHPCTQWALKSKENYQWLIQLNLEVCKEYTRRYGRRHKAEDITLWYQKNMPKLPDIGMTPFVLAMPDDCKSSCPVTSYRKYYLKYKSKFAKWKTKTPEWYIKYK